MLYKCKNISLKMLKDEGMAGPKSVETRKHPRSKTGDDGMPGGVGQDHATGIFADSVNHSPCIFPLKQFRCLW